MDVTTITTTVIRYDCSIDTTVLQKAYVYNLTRLSFVGTEKNLFSIILFFLFKPISTISVLINNHSL